MITGTAVVSDYCEQVGPEYTGLTIAIPSGGLSTLSYDVPVGSSIENVSEGYTKRLDPRDLHCPKWGVEKHNGGLGGWKVGPPFMPIILAPPELLSINTDWARCHYPTDVGWIVTYGIFDPPRFLTPAGPDLIQSITPVAETVVTTSQTPKSTGREAQPASQISGSAAKTTHLAALDPLPTPLPDSDRSAIKILDPIKAAPTSVSKAAPKKHDPSSHGAVDDPSSGDPNEFDPLDPDRPNPTKQDTSDPAGVDILKLIDPTRSDSLDPDRPNPTKQDTSDPAGVDIVKLIDPTRSDTLDSDRHGSIHPDSHLKKPQVVSPSDSNREPDVGVNGPQTTIDIDGVMYTAFEQVRPSQAAQSKVGGNEASIGGNGHFTTVNIGGITYSAFGADKPVQKNGAKELGGEMGLESKGPRATVNLGEIIFGAFGGHTSSVRPSVITIGGSKITARPSGLFFDGTVLSEGDLPITIAGTPILIDPSGILIGSERVIFTPADPIITGRPTPLDSPSSLVGPDLGGPVSPDPVITKDGQIITVINPSAIAVNGITLSANAPAATISGVVYTIDSSGELVMNDPNTDLSAAGTLALVSSIITVDGLAITEEPDRIMVGGLTLTLGGSSVIISGTPIRLGASGVLVVGTHSIDIPQITLPPALVSSTLNFGGLKITEKPDQVIVGGLTLTPGGSAVTISGTSISLGSRGILVVGTSTVDLTKETSPIISSQGTTTANGNNPIEASGAPKELYSLNPWKIFLWVFLGVQIIR